MSANNYELCVSALTGTVYISKISKRNPNEMTDDRREVFKGEFIKAIIDWTANQLKPEHNTLTLTAGGKPVIEIRLINKDI